jgi:hypothetical protein
MTVVLPIQVLLVVSPPILSPTPGLEPKDRKINGLLCRNIIAENWRLGGETLMDRLLPQYWFQPARLGGDAYHIPVRASDHME